ncbi:MAG: flagellar filament capping protein FliD [Nitrospira sp.]|nr:flagellar filament capping protein FliD [Nitrospira sp.]MDR4486342.1 flagellar filament capping protein FliD [Nitrospirales bacterium]
MPSISFGGLGNGIDFGQVVDLLVQVQRQPIDRLTQRKLTEQSKLTDIGLLGARLSSLQASASSLRTKLSFDKTQVNVTSGSTKTLLSATASSGAAQGTYTVRVNQLASSHQITSKSGTAVSSIDTDIVSGASGTFSFQVGSGSVQTVNLSATSTLEDLKDAINDLGAGVGASLLNTGTEVSPQYRLVLSSNNTGADYAISITADDTDLNTVGSGVDTFQAALDSEVELGVTDVGAGTQAITINRSTNTLTDVIAGVTLNLEGEDTLNPVSITVSQDNEAVKESISSFVKSYNDVISFINERTNYDPQTKERGIFVGESLPRSVVSSLRGAIFSEISGLTTLTSASQIGFETQTTDGTIKLNEATLDQALSENYSAVRDLFIANTTTGTNGIAELLIDAVDNLNDVETGAFTLRQEGLNSAIANFSSQIDRKETQLVKFEELLRIKFANLDGLLASLQSQQDTLNARLGQ